MGAFELATISILFLASLPRQAQGCFSKHNCCNESRIQDFVRSFQDTDSESDSMSRSSAADWDCQASSGGPVARRSISPWGYTRDFSETRYPQNLWQASCSCEHCLSFKSSLHKNLRTYRTLEARGNSVTIQHNTIVFYRLSCPKRLGWFYLEPHTYVVNVSCACVVPRYAS